MSVEGAPFHNADEYLRQLESRAPVVEVNLERLRSQAEQAVTFWRRVHEHSGVKLAEAEEAMLSLSRHGRKRPKAKSSSLKSQVSDSTYRALLTELSNHGYASGTTLAGGASFSLSQSLKAMRLAVKRGHATEEVVSRGRKRFTITEAGVEYVTTS